jgi:hypothetical protein
VGYHCASFWCRKIQPISSAVSKYWEGPPTVWLPTVFKDQLVLGSTPFTKLVRWPLHLGMPYLHPSKYSRSNYFKSKTFVMTFFSQNTTAKIWFLFLSFVFLLLPKWKSFHFSFFNFIWIFFPKQIESILEKFHQKLKKTDQFYWPLSFFRKTNLLRLFEYTPQWKKQTNQNLIFSK